MLTFVECLMSGIPAFNKAIRDLSMDELNAIFQETALGEQRISEIKERRRKLKNRYYFLYFQGKLDSYGNISSLG